MTATLSTRAELGDDYEDSEIEVDYTYDGSPRELVMESVIAAGAQVWHLLSDRQRRRIEEECLEDYYGRMEQDPRRVRGGRL